MNRILASVAALAALSACGDGNPFEDNATGSGSGGGSSSGITIPTTIANDLDSLSYDPATNTLTVTGLTQDGVPVANNYRHVAATFAPGYETFTAQNDPLGRHATAFVAGRDGVRAGVVMTGGQFNRIFGGAYYERDGGFNPPAVTTTSGDVSYYGNYAGLINGPGQPTDLLPVTSGPDPDNPVQAGYVTGLAFINVDFADNSVEGEIFDRTLTWAGAPAALPDIVLIQTDLAPDGTFSGTEIEYEGILNNDIGDYAGLIGGPGGSVIAGGISLTEFSDDFDNEIEYGVFVLDLCTAASTEPICQNTLQP